MKIITALWTSHGRGHSEIELSHILFAPFVND